MKIGKVLHTCWLFIFDLHLSVSSPASLDLRHTPRCTCAAHVKTCVRFRSGLSRAAGRLRLQHNSAAGAWRSSSYCRSLGLLFRMLLSLNRISLERYEAWALQRSHACNQRRPTVTCAAAASAFTVLQALAESAAAGPSADVPDGEAGTCCSSKQDVVHAAQSIAACSLTAFVRVDNLRHTAADMLLV